MNKTFQSFVLGCRVNEAERMKIDRELVEAGYTIDLASPSILIINTCAVTGKAEREARQLIFQLRKKHPQAQIVVTGCVATVWQKYQTEEEKLADILVPNDKKSSLVGLLTATHATRASLVTASVNRGSVAEEANDKFRYSNRLVVKIQDGCHRFCSYCIVPFLRGLPQSPSVTSIISYINSYVPTPSEVVLSAINTESFGKDTGESLVTLIKAVLKDTKVPRLAFGSIHPWSLTPEFIDYYKTGLSKNPRFINFFHVPIQSGSQTMLKTMKRDYDVQDIVQKLQIIQKIQPNALIVIYIIVGYLGETEKLFEETYSLLKKRPISRLHVFRFSNRPHTAAYYLRKQLKEPTADEKKNRSAKLLELSNKKYSEFLSSQIGRSCDALVITQHKTGYKLLLDNHTEGHIEGKHCLPGQVLHVTIIAAKDGALICS